MGATTSVPTPADIRQMALANMDRAAAVRALKKQTACLDGLLSLKSLRRVWTGMPDITVSSARVCVSSDRAIFQKAVCLPRFAKYNFELQGGSCKITLPPGVTASLQKHKQSQAKKATRAQREKVRLYGWFDRQRDDACRHLMKLAKKGVLTYRQRWAGAQFSDMRKAIDYYKKTPSDIRAVVEAQYVDKGIMAWTVNTGPKPAIIPATRHQQDAFLRI
jgi:hypothetical protein